MKTGTKAELTEAEEVEDPWIGEILDRRYAVIDPVDGQPRFYHAHDMQTHQRVVLRITAAADGTPHYVIAPPLSEKAVEEVEANPVHAPVDDVPVELSVDEISILSDDPEERMEAAWFAQGEAFEEGDPLEEAAGDYRTLQEKLVQLASDLSDEVVLRYSLQTVPT